MKNLFLLLLSIIILGCFSSEQKKYNQIDLEEKVLTNNDGKDTIKLNTRPSTVIVTGIENHKLVTVYKEMYNKRLKKKYINSNSYHSTYFDNWNNNFMPGIEAVYGYNMRNIAYYNTKTGDKKILFEKPALIKTLYYPSYSKDTLNGKPIKRDYYIVSVYDQDTNQDTIINYKDLRKLYHFNKNCTIKTQLIPSNYSVLSSEYDSKDDLMYIFARLDSNKNGKRDDDEPIHIFWIDLKNVMPAKRLY